MNKNEIENKLVYEPNFTCMPNVICDYWMQILSLAEFKVLLCIWRKTFEFENESKISLKQIGDMTGLSKPGILKCLGSLIKHQVINKVLNYTKDGGNDVSSYSIDLIVLQKGI